MSCVCVAWRKSRRTAAATEKPSISNHTSPRGSSRKTRTVLDGLRLLGGRRALAERSLGLGRRDEGHLRRVVRADALEDVGLPSVAVVGHPAVREMDACGEQRICVSAVLAPEADGRGHSPHSSNRASSPPAPCASNWPTPAKDGLTLRPRTVEGRISSADSSERPELPGGRSTRKSAMRAASSSYETLSRPRRMWMEPRRIRTLQSEISEHGPFRLCRPPPKGPPSWSAPRDPRSEEGQAKQKGDDALGRSRRPRGARRRREGRAR